MLELFYFPATCCQCICKIQLIFFVDLITEASLVLQITEEFLLFVPASASVPEASLLLSYCAGHDAGVVPDLGEVQPFTMKCDEVLSLLSLAEFQLATVLRMLMNIGLYFYLLLEIFVRFADGLRSISLLWFLKKSVQFLLNSSPLKAFGFAVFFVQGFI